jgi:hypothetical protein
MKDAASCVKWCELQDTLSTKDLNGHSGLGISVPGPRPSEGRFYNPRERAFIEGAAGLRSLSPPWPSPGKTGRLKMVAGPRDLDGSTLESHGFRAGRRRSGPTSKRPRTETAYLSGAPLLNCRPRIGRDHPPNLSI